MGDREILGVIAPFVVQQVVYHPSNVPYISQSPLIAVNLLYQPIIPLPPTALFSSYSIPIQKLQNYSKLFRNVSFYLVSSLTKHVEPTA